MAIGRKRDMKRMYKETWIEEYAQQYGVSEEEAELAYKEHNADEYATKLTYDQLVDEISDMMMAGNMDWDEVSNRFEASMEGKNTDAVLSDVYDKCHEQALAEAEGGNWNTVNDQYLTDEERSDIALKEQDGYDYDDDDDDEEEDEDGLNC